MAEISAVPATARWAVTCGLNLEVDAAPSLGDPVIVPYNIAHYQLDEFRMRGGWPVPVPSHDIRATALVSTSGESLDNRLHPTQVNTGAAVRWLASADSWDATSLTWRPWQGRSNWVWRSAAPYAPVFYPDYPYRVKSQILYRDVLHLDSAGHQHLWSQFAGAPSHSFSLILAVSIITGFGGTGPGAPIYGVLNPGLPTPGGSVTTFAEDVGGARFGLNLQANTLLGSVDDVPETTLLPVAQALEHTGPSYLGITVSYPKVTVYMGLGPSRMRFAEMTMPANTANHLTWALGRTTGSVLQSADMSVFDVGFYVNPLTHTEMLAEVAALAGVYGGS